jgi:hypothetical protein
MHVISNDRGRRFRIQPQPSIDQNYLYWHAPRPEANRELEYLQIAWLNAHGSYARLAVTMSAVSFLDPSQPEEVQ